MQQDRMFDNRQNADHAGSPKGLTCTLLECRTLLKAIEFPRNSVTPTSKSAGMQPVKPEAKTRKGVSSASPLVAIAIAAVCLLNGCTRSPDVPVVQETVQSGNSEIPAIERYRAALTGVSASRQALALEMSRFSDEDWSGVAKRSLDHANELQDRTQRLMDFDEAASAAETLRSHVTSLQRQLKGIDAERWQSTLPDLLLTNEAIQSAVDELTDLAAPGPDDMPVHDHDHEHEDDPL